LPTPQNLYYARLEQARKRYPLSKALQQLQQAILKQPREEAHTMLETIARKIFEEGKQEGTYARIIDSMVELS